MNLNFWHANLAYCLIKLKHKNNEGNKIQFN